MTELLDVHGDLNITKGVVLRGKSGVMQWWALPRVFRVRSGVKEALKGEYRACMLLLGTPLPAVLPAVRRIIDSRCLPLPPVTAAASPTSVIEPTYSHILTSSVVVS